MFCELRFLNHNDNRNRNRNRNSNDISHFVILTRFYCNFHRLVTGKRWLGKRMEYL